MFTGIIDHTARLLSITPRGGGAVLQVQTQFTDLTLGESIALDGACLTVESMTDTGIAEFYISPETIAVTNLSQCQVGQGLHCERALCVGDRLGGHWVTGHVDELVTLTDKQVVGESMRLRFSGSAKHIQRYCVHKGSIALAGVSLTLNTVSEDTFEVMLIPHTLSMTHCKDWAVGDVCHVEYDYLLKWAARAASPSLSAVGEVK